MEIKDLQESTGKLFVDHFGRTPLTARLRDILNEALELSRHSDVANLREEAGDLGASLMSLCAECSWNLEELILASHKKIQRRAAQYRSLGRKTKVALLGGAFDPPTLGHIAVAKFVLSSSREFDSVWLVPCYQHMYNKSLTPASHRIAMCKLAVAKDARLRVFDYEVEHQLRGETYHFVQRLLEERFAKDEYDFSIIIGMDNANTFDRWVNFRELERMIRFVVVPRAGETPDRKVDWYLRPPHIFLRADVDLPQTSSTEVRNLVSGCKTLPIPPMHARLAELLDPAVAAYIEEHNLYVHSE